MHKSTNLSRSRNVLNDNFRARWSFLIKLFQTGMLKQWRKKFLVDRTGFEPVASRTSVRWQLQARIAKRALCQSELPAPTLFLLIPFFKVTLACYGEIFSKRVSTAFFTFIQSFLLLITYLCFLVHLPFLLVQR